MNVGIGIVLYNFNLDKVKKILEEYYNIAKYIILVDNSSDSINELEKLIKEQTNIILIKNNENKGIATALNQILQTSQEKEIDYLLTLDQDSFLKSNDMEKMLRYMSEDVAIVCPEIMDLNKKKNKFIKNDFELINRCITSGSIMNLKICKQIGKFDEKMFIDYVDFDYSKRIQLAGYKILKIKNCFLKHEIGKRTTRKFFGIYVYPTNHSSFRVYYYFRNMHYYYLKYKKQMTFSEKINEIIRILWKFISIILYEDDKQEKLKNASKGYRDAWKIIIK